MKHPKNKLERKIIYRLKTKRLYTKTVRCYCFDIPLWYKNGVPKRYYFQSKYWKNQANRYIRRKKLSEIKQYKKEYPYVWKIW